MTLLYFVVSSLDVLGAVDVVDAEEAISWIYSLQVDCVKVGLFSTHVSPRFSPMKMGVRTVAVSEGPLAWETRTIPRVNHKQG